MRKAARRIHFFKTAACVSENGVARIKMASCHFDPRDAQPKATEHIEEARTLTRFMTEVVR
jgi:hypothetical protein